MQKILQFRPRRTTERACVGCGERFPKSAPHFWTYCRKCYSFASFRRAVETFRAVRP